MRKLSAFLLLTMFFTACQFKSEDVTTNLLGMDGTEVQGQNLEGNEFVQALSASFLSEGQSFAYNLSYDGALMQLVDGQFEGADVVGPSFEVNGGAQVVVTTGPISEWELRMTTAGDPEDMNGILVYWLNSKEGGCSVDRAVTPVEEEVLVMTLKVCEGQEVLLGQRALYGLLDRMEIEVL